MTVKIEGHGPDFEKIINEINKLNKYQVAVGFFGDRDAKLLQIVRANEYGAHIVPKNKKGYLFVPYKKKDGTKGYYKLKSVTIPARPFIRMAWIEHQNKYKRYVIAGLNGIVNGTDTAMGLLNRLGIASVIDIRNSAIRWSKPGNAPLTIENKGSNNPLIDTGELVDKVTYKIIPVL